MASQTENEPCHISKLPNDCRARIIDFLLARDVKNLRLVCRDWEGICIRGLFNAIYSIDSFDSKKKASDPVEYGVFSTRPQLDDMERLHEISQRKWIAKHVRCLDVYAGDFLEERLREGLRGKLEENDLWEPLYKGLVLCPEQILERIKANHRHCDPQILIQAFGNFINLDSLSMTSRVPPFCSWNTAMHIGWIKMWNMGREPIDIRREPIDTRRSEDRYRDVAGQLRG